MTLNTQTLAEAGQDIESLDEFINASDSTDIVTRKAATYPSLNKLAKSIKANYGRIFYETKAAMVSAGAPPNGELAEVWNDPILNNNGVYGFNTTWVKSVVASVVSSVASVAQILADWPVVTNGSALGNAVNYDGNSTTGTDNTSGGWLIPANKNGRATFSRYKFFFSAEESAKLTGKKVRLVAYGNTSDNLLDEILITSGTYTSGNSEGGAGIADNVEIVQISTNQVMFRMDYQFVGTETEVSFFVQVSTVNPSTTEIRSLHVYNMGIIPLDSSNADFIFNAVKKKYQPTLTELSLFPVALLTDGQALTGALHYDGTTSVGADSSSGGWIIPAGQTGRTTYSRYKFIFTERESADLAGKSLRFHVECISSDDLINSLSAYTWSVPSGAFDKKVETINGNVYLSFSYTFIGNETDEIKTFLQVSNANTAITFDRWLVAVNQAYYFINDFTNTELTKNTFARLNALERTNFYEKVINVSKDGVSDYLNLKAACDAEMGGKSANSRLKIIVHEGIYPEKDYHIPNNCDVIAKGRVWLKGELPVNASKSDIVTTETVWVNDTSTLQGLKITAKNMRYPVHSESGASNKRAVQIFKRCHIEHYGNQEAQDYYTSINAGEVWANTTAFGCGSHSGETFIFDDCIIISPTNALSIHNNLGFDEPSECFVYGGRLEGKDAAIRAQSLGSGQTDIIKTFGTIIKGPIEVNDNPWLATDPKDHNADRNEFHVTINGSQPVAVRADFSCEALVLKSIDDIDSDVQISGDGADALFGVNPYVKLGSIGYPVRVMSSLGISETEGYSLADRLGDLSAASKTLNITFDGSVNKVITLDDNYIGMSNTAIIALLNAALADANRTFESTEAETANKYEVYQPEYEIFVENTGATAILAGMGAEYDTSYEAVKIATSATSKDDFAGLAIDNIPVGSIGRVSRGVMLTDYINNSNLSSVFKQFAKIGNTDGEFEITVVAGDALLMCVDGVTPVFKVI